MIVAFGKLNFIYNTYFVILLLNNLFKPNIGNITELHSHSRMYSSRMYMMDIRNFTWVENFEVIENTENTNNKTEESSIFANSQRIKIMIGVIIGVIGTVLLLGFIGFFGYKMRENRDRAKRLKQVKHIEHVVNE
jgi:hypothetical protein